MRAILFGILVLAGGASGLSDESQNLKDLLAEEWSARMTDDPLTATLMGHHEENHRLPDLTVGSLALSNQRDRSFRERVQAIDRSELDPNERVSCDLFEFLLEGRIRRYEFGEYRRPFTNDSGFYSSLIRAFERMPLKTGTDFEIYLTRLAAVPKYVRQNIALMRTGLKTGFTMPRVVMPGVEGVLRGMAETSLGQQPIYLAFVGALNRLPARQRAVWQKRCRESVATNILPLYQELYEFVATEYAPGCQDAIGATSLPNGRDYYRFLVRYFTTLETSPEDVHQTGLAEVKRIREEMEAVVESLNYEGDFKSFLDYLRSDARFYARSGDELLKEAAWIAKRIDGMLPGYFGRLPRMPYGVAAVPAHLAPNYTTGRYSPGVPGGDQGGFYWVNTYALEKRPLYALPALTLHEAVPGHHLQIALAQELTGVPEFRRQFYPNAFGEGWALYAEKLGREMGMYRNAYEEFGRLTYEMWRAARLVVDTGMHYFDWDRDRAVRLLVENTALSRHNIETEVDRYISWPGQALSYKMGELTILQLRARAEETLGEHFDLRHFHDAVLAHGGVTMSVLQAQIASYIRAALPVP